MTEKIATVKVHRNTDDRLLLACSIGRNKKCYKTVRELSHEHEAVLEDIKTEHKYMDEMSVYTELYARKAFALLVKKRLAVDVFYDGWESLCKAIEKHSKKYPDAPCDFRRVMRDYINHMGGDSQLTDEEIEVLANEYQQQEDEACDWDNPWKIVKLGTA